jgi:hypothetical protein
MRFPMGKHTCARTSACLMMRGLCACQVGAVVGRKWTLHGICAYMCGECSLCGEHCFTSSCLVRGGLQRIDDPGMGLLLPCWQMKPWMTRLITGGL